MKDKHQLYNSAQSFRQALEDRLRNISLSKNIPIDRLRKNIAFDRFLTRLFISESRETPKWLLKGGYALEVRFAEIARTTKDIDISIPIMKNPSSDSIHEKLRITAEKDMNDWFEFIVGTVKQNLHQPNYGGWRYPIESRLAGRVFTKFHIDVVVGDAVVSIPEWKKGSELLSFAGIEPVEIALYPKSQHFAEKIHSFTFPQDKRKMSRVRDFVDLVLLIEIGLPDKDEIISAIKATFKRRKTHEIPKHLEFPPQSWEESYINFAQDCGVKCKNMQDAFKLLTEYFGNLFK